MKAGSRVGKDNNRRIGLAVVALSALFLVIGFFVAIKFDGAVDRTKEAKVQFVSFGGMSVTSAAGRMVVSFDLEVAPSNLAAAIKAKALLEARFKSDLSAFDPNAFYSRKGKEWLASHMRMVANQEMGGELVSAVYFGDFKIFGSKSVATTS